MDLFWIRHGESTNNALADATQRIADPPLTARGRQQARRLAAFVRRGGHLDPAERNGAPPLDELHCSPMRRSLETARPVAVGLGLPSRVRVDVHEIGGMWVAGTAHVPGMHRAAMAADFPEAQIPEQIGDHGWWQGGQESAAAGTGRAIQVVQDLRRQAAADAEAGRRPRRLAIISHGDFMSGIVKAFADHLPQEGLYYEHHNTGITRFRLGRRGCRVVYVNRAVHVEDEDPQDGRLDAAHLEDLEGEEGT